MVVASAVRRRSRSNLTPAVRFVTLDRGGLGPPARERRRNALDLFAAFFREQRSRTLGEGQPRAELPWTGYIGAVYATRQLASDLLDAEDEPDLDALGEDLQTWLADLFRER